MTSHLVIPDPHSHPDFSNDRFRWLSKLVYDLKPDVLINIGDWADMPSLCSYERGTKGFEGRRYHRDINSANHALELLCLPLRARKKKQPRKIALLGNHDERINKAIQSDAAKLDGLISTGDIQFREWGWEVVPYRGGTPGIIEVDGISYAHFFSSGVMGKPIGGIHPAYQMIQKQYVSCTQGHVHTTDYCVRSNARGDHIQALVCGCFFDYEADYAGEVNDMWWRGVIYKDNVEDGRYDPSWISLESIRKEYS